MYDILSCSEFSGEEREKIENLVLKHGGDVGKVKETILNERSRMQSGEIDNSEYDTRHNWFVNR